jgi:hypothetical protein
VKCPAVFTAGLLTQTGMMPLLIARRPTALLVHSSGTYTYLLTYICTSAYSEFRIYTDSLWVSNDYILSFQLEITQVNNDLKTFMVAICTYRLIEGRTFFGFDYSN